MAEEVKEKVEVTDAEREERLASAIARGLSASLPDAIRAANPERQSPPPAAVVQPPIDDVSDEAVLEAIESGDKPKAAALMRRQRAADRERARREDLSPILNGGGAALASLAQQAAENLPHYKKFRKEIDGKIEQWKATNPGAIVTLDHYKAAHNLVRGEHAEELEAQAREAGIRQGREPEAPLIPEGGRHLESDGPNEPTTLQDALSGDWKSEFKTKQRAVGGRSDDEEMRKAGFQSVQGFLQARKNLEQLSDELGTESFGLDREWSKREKRWLTPEESRDLGIGE